MVDKDLALAIEAIQALQDAAGCLLSGREHQAEQLVLGMSEQPYELVLCWHDRSPQDYLYFLARYVLSATDFDPEQRPGDEHIERYRNGMLNPATAKPKRVYINNRPVVIDWEMLQEEALEAT